MFMLNELINAASACVNASSDVKFDENSPLHDLCSVLDSCHDVESIARILSLWPSHSMFDDILSLLKETLLNYSPIRNLQIELYCSLISHILTAYGSSEYVNKLFLLLSDTKYNPNPVLIDSFYKCLENALQRRGSKRTPQSFISLSGWDVPSAAASSISSTNLFASFSKENSSESSTLMTNTSTAYCSLNFDGDRFPFSKDYSFFINFKVSKFASGVGEDKTSLIRLIDEKGASLQLWLQEGIVHFSSYEPQESSSSIKSLFSGGKLLDNAAKGIKAASGIMRNLEGSINNQGFISVSAPSTELVENQWCSLYIHHSHKTNFLGGTTSDLVIYVNGTRLLSTHDVPYPRSLVQNPLLLSRMGEGLIGELGSIYVFGDGGNIFLSEAQQSSLLNSYLQGEKVPSLFREENSMASDADIVSKLVAGFHPAVRMPSTDALLLPYVGKGGMPLDHTLEGGGVTAPSIQLMSPSRSEGQITPRDDSHTALGQTSSPLSVLEGTAPTQILVDFLSNRKSSSVVAQLSLHGSCVVVTMGCSLQDCLQELGGPVVLLPLLGTSTSAVSRSLHVLRSQLGIFRSPEETRALIKRDIAANSLFMTLGESCLLGTSSASIGKEENSVESNVTAATNPTQGVTTASSRGSLFPDGAIKGVGMSPYPLQYLSNFSGIRSSLPTRFLNIVSLCLNDHLGNAEASVSSGFMILLQLRLAEILEEDGRYWQLQPPCTHSLTNPANASLDHMRSMSSSSSSSTSSNIPSSAETGLPLDLSLCPSLDMGLVDALFRLARTCEPLSELLISCSRSLVCWLPLFSFCASQVQLHYFWQLRSFMQVHKSTVASYVSVAALTDGLFLWFRLITGQASAVLPERAFPSYFFTLDELYGGSVNNKEAVATPLVCVDPLFFPVPRCLQGSKVESGSNVKSVDSPVSITSLLKDVRLYYEGCGDMPVLLGMEPVVYPSSSVEEIGAAAVEAARKLADLLRFSPSFIHHQRQFERSESTSSNDSPSIDSTEADVEGIHLHVHGGFSNRHIFDSETQDILLDCAILCVATVLGAGFLAFDPFAEYSDEVGCICGGAVSSSIARHKEFQENSTDSCDCRYNERGALLHVHASDAEIDALRVLEENGYSPQCPFLVANSLESDTVPIYSLSRSVPGDARLVHPTEIAPLLLLLLTASRGESTFDDTASLKLRVINLITAMVDHDCSHIRPGSQASSIAKAAQEALLSTQYNSVDVLSSRSDGSAGGVDKRDDELTKTLLDSIVASNGFLVMDALDSVCSDFSTLMLFGLLPLVDSDLLFAGILRAIFYSQRELVRRTAKWDKILQDAASKIGEELYNSMFSSQSTQNESVNNNSRFPHNRSPTDSFVRLRPSSPSLNQPNVPSASSGGAGANPLFMVNGWDISEGGVLPTAFALTSSGSLLTSTPSSAASSRRSRLAAKFALDEEQVSGLSEDFEHLLPWGESPDRLPPAQGAFTADPQTAHAGGSSAWASKFQSGHGFEIVYYLLKLHISRNRDAERAFRAAINSQVASVGPRNPRSSARKLTTKSKNLFTEDSRFTPTSTTSSVTGNTPWSGNGSKSLSLILSDELQCAALPECIVSVLLEALTLPDPVVIFATTLMEQLAQLAASGLSVSSFADFFGLSSSGGVSTASESAQRSKLKFQAGVKTTLSFFFSYVSKEAREAGLVVAAEHSLTRHTRPSSYNPDWARSHYRYYHFVTQNSFVGKSPNSARESDWCCGGLNCARVGTYCNSYCGCARARGAGGCVCRGACCARALSLAGPSSQFIPSLSNFILSANGAETAKQEVLLTYTCEGFRAPLRPESSRILSLAVSQSLPFLKVKPSIPSNRQAASSLDLGGSIVEPSALALALRALPLMSASTALRTLLTVHKNLVSTPRSIRTVVALCPEWESLLLRFLLRLRPTCYPSVKETRLLEDRIRELFVLLDGNKGKKGRVEKNKMSGFHLSPLANADEALIDALFACTERLLYLLVDDSLDMAGGWIVVRNILAAAPLCNSNNVIGANSPTSPPAGQPSNAQFALRPQDWLVPSNAVTENEKQILVELELLHGRRIVFGLLSHVVAEMDASRTRTRALTAAHVDNLIHITALVERELSCGAIAMGNLSPTGIVFNTQTFVSKWSELIERSLSEASVPLSASASVPTPISAVPPSVPSSNSAVPSSVRNLSELKNEIKSISRQEGRLLQVDVQLVLSLLRVWQSVTLPRREIEHRILQCYAAEFPRSGPLHFLLTSMSVWLLRVCQPGSPAALAALDILRAITTFLVKQNVRFDLTLFSSSQFAGTGGTAETVRLSDFVAPGLASSVTRSASGSISSASSLSQSTTTPGTAPSLLNAASNSWECPSLPGRAALRSFECLSIVLYSLNSYLRGVQIVSEFFIKQSVSLDDLSLPSRTMNYSETTVQTIFGCVKYELEALAAAAEVAVDTLGVVTSDASSFLRAYLVSPSRLTGLIDAHNESKLQAGILRSMMRSSASASHTTPADSSASGTVHEATTSSPAGEDDYLNVPVEDDSLPGLTPRTPVGVLDLSVLHDAEGDQFDALLEQQLYPVTSKSSENMNVNDAVGFSVSPSSISDSATTTPQSYSALLRVMWEWLDGNSIGSGWVRSPGWHSAVPEALDLAASASTLSFDFIDQQVREQFRLLAEGVRADAAMLEALAMRHSDRELASVEFASASMTAARSLAAASMNRFLARKQRYIAALAAAGALPASLQSPTSSVNTEKALELISADISNMKNLRSYSLRTRHHKRYTRKRHYLSYQELYGDLTLLRILARHANSPQVLPSRHKASFDHVLMSPFSYLIGSDKRGAVATASTGLRRPNTGDIVNAAKGGLSVLKRGLRKGFENIQSVLDTSELLVGRRAVQTQGLDTLKPVSVATTAAGGSLPKSETPRSARMSSLGSSLQMTSPGLGGAGALSDTISSPSRPVLRDSPGAAQQYDGSVFSDLWSILPLAHITVSHLEPSWWPACATRFVRACAGHSSLSRAHLLHLESLFSRRNETNNLARNTFTARMRTLMASGLWLRLDALSADMRALDWQAKECTDNGDLIPSSHPIDFTAATYRSGILGVRIAATKTVSASRGSDASAVPLDRMEVTESVTIVPSDLPLNSTVVGISAFEGSENSMLANGANGETPPVPVDESTLVEKENEPFSSEHHRSVTSLMEDMPSAELLSALVAVNIRDAQRERAISQDQVENFPGISPVSGSAPTEEDLPVELGDLSHTGAIPIFEEVGELDELEELSAGVDGMDGDLDEDEVLRRLDAALKTPSMSMSLSGSALKRKGFSIVDVTSPSNETDESRELGADVNDERRADESDNGSVASSSDSISSDISSDLEEIIDNGIPDADPTLPSSFPLFQSLKGSFSLMENEELLLESSSRWIRAERTWNGTFFLTNHHIFFVPSPDTDDGLTAGSGAVDIAVSIRREGMRCLCRNSPNICSNECQTISEGDPLIAAGRFCTRREMGSGPSHVSSCADPADPLARLVRDFIPPKPKRWSLRLLERALPRRFLLRQCALEFFFTDESVLFAFPPLTDASHSQSAPQSIVSISTVMEKIAMMKPPRWRVNGGPMDVSSSRSMQKFLQQSNLMENWREGKISNFDYLMELNRLAGRSFHDLTQYPVFPWVLADYRSSQLDLSATEAYRDLSKPIGALNPSRLELFKSRMEGWSVEDTGIPPFLYGSHYSSAGSTLFYLIRLEPFTSLSVDLQGGRFDVADRLFFSVEGCWHGVCHSNSDVKELIPQWYCLPEMFENAQFRMSPDAPVLAPKESMIDHNLSRNGVVPLGNLQEGPPVGDVILPPWTKGSSRAFVGALRTALESDYVSARLHLWIDLIFGCKQRGPLAVEHDNLFFHLTYENAVDLASMSDPAQRRAAASQVLNFGQTPSQLFRSPHPPRIPQIPRRLFSFHMPPFAASGSASPLCLPVGLAAVPTPGHFSMKNRYLSGFFGASLFANTSSIANPSNVPGGGGLEASDARFGPLTLPQDLIPQNLANLTLDVYTVSPSPFVPAQLKAIEAAKAGAAHYKTLDSIPVGSLVSVEDAQIDSLMFTECLSPYLLHSNSPLSPSSVEDVLGNDKRTMREMAVETSIALLRSHYKERLRAQRALRAHPMSAAVMPLLISPSFLSPLLFSLQHIFVLGNRIYSIFPDSYTIGRLELHPSNVGMGLGGANPSSGGLGALAELTLPPFTYEREPARNCPGHQFHIFNAINRKNVELKPFLAVEDFYDHPASNNIFSGLNSIRATASATARASPVHSVDAYSGAFIPPNHESSILYTSHTFSGGGRCRSKMEKNQPRIFSTHSQTALALQTYLSEAYPVLPLHQQFSAGVGPQLDGLDRPCLLFSAGFVDGAVRWTLLGKSTQDSSNFDRSLLWEETTIGESGISGKENEVGGYVASLEAVSVLYVESHSLLLVGSANGTVTIYSLIRGLQTTDGTYMVPKPVVMPSTINTENKDLPNPRSAGNRNINNLVGPFRPKNIRNINGTVGVSVNEENRRLNEQLLAVCEESSKSLVNPHLHRLLPLLTGAASIVASYFPGFETGISLVGIGLLDGSCSPVTSLHFDSFSVFVGRLDGSISLFKGRCIRTFLPPVTRVCFLSDHANENIGKSEQIKDTLPSVCIAQEALPTPYGWISFVPVACIYTNMLYPFGFFQNGGDITTNISGPASINGGSGVGVTTILEESSEALNSTVDSIDESMLTNSPLHKTNSSVSRDGAVISQLLPLDILPPSSSVLSPVARDAYRRTHAHDVELHLFNNPLLSVPKQESSNSRNVHSSNGSQVFSPSSVSSAVSAPSSKGGKSISTSSASAFVSRIDYSQYIRNPLGNAKLALSPLHLRLHDSECPVTHLLTLPSGEILAVWNIAVEFDNLSIVPFSSAFSSNKLGETDLNVSGGAGVTEGSNSNNSMGARARTRTRSRTRGRTDSTDLLSPEPDRTIVHRSIAAVYATNGDIVSMVVLNTPTSQPSYVPNYGGGSLFSGGMTAASALKVPVLFTQCPAPLVTSVLVNSDKLVNTVIFGFSSGHVSIRHSQSLECTGFTVLHDDGVLRTSAAPMKPFASSQSWDDSMDSPALRYIKKEHDTAALVRGSSFSIQSTSVTSLAYMDDSSILAGTGDGRLIMITDKNIIDLKE